MSDWKWFSPEEIASWPAEHKRCRGCQEVLPFSKFHKNVRTLFGLDTKCKDCKKIKSKNEYMNQTVEYQLWNGAKARAKKLGRKFDIEVSDIDVPEFCPILGIRLVKNLGGKAGDNSPSLDRIDSSKGYVKGNVQVVSYRANVLKSNASPWELRTVADYVERTSSNNMIRVGSMIA
ncbi:endonuclease [Streptomyces phage NootNoot]|uniref:HNH endonuclease n=1 Tax=Streptomyces phage NootNoot TaxID=2023992 RepID=A0A222YYD8_9CAUD|nr:endonuclease [Streptomyces phage NootNoot]ASR77308.1 HNH endonuclease [Streptomyces phage NootNoot]